jgi:hypothetical protein
VFDKALPNALQQPVIRALPYLVVEYFNFDWPAVAGGVYGLA